MKLFGSIVISEDSDKNNMQVELFLFVVTDSMKCIQYNIAQFFLLGSQWEEKNPQMHSSCWLRAILNG